MIKPASIQPKACLLCVKDLQAGRDDICVPLAPTLHYFHSGLNTTTVHVICHNFTYYLSFESSRLEHQVQASSGKWPLIAAQFCRVVTPPCCKVRQPELTRVRHFNGQGGQPPKNQFFFFFRIFIQHRGNPQIGFLLHGMNRSIID